MKKPRPGVSDHAVIRWLERVYGIDIEAVRSHILTPAISNAITLGAHTTTVDGWTYVLGDNQIITIHATMEDETDVRKRKRYREFEDD